MPKLNLSKIQIRTGTTYPAPLNAEIVGRSAQRLGDAGGLTQFGANLVTLSPGAWASHRHEHSAEDECVYIISGHPTLVDNDGRTALSPGDVCTHPAGDGNPHHLINDSDADVVFLVIGSRTPEIDSATYPDVDMDLPANGTPRRAFLRKDGTPY